MLKSAAGYIALAAVLVIIPICIVVLPGLVMGDYKCSGGERFDHDGDGYAETFVPMNCRWVK